MSGLSSFSEGFFAKVENSFEKSRKKTLKKKPFHPSVFQEFDLNGV